MNQADKVEKYINDFGSITQKEAIDDLAVYRLSAIIYILRYERGHKISREFEAGVNRYGEKTSYARYKWAVT